MRKLRTGFVVTAIFLVALACNARTALPPEAAPAASAPQTRVPAKESWEQEWDKTAAEAKAEGKVVIAGNLGASADVLRQVLKDQYGVEAEFIIGRGAEVVNKIIAEQNAGLYLVDVIFSTTTSIITVLKPQGKVDRIDTELVLPEVKDPRLWWRNEIPWVDKEQRYHIAFFANAKSTIMLNTGMAKKEEINSYNDLLDPKWKGKIVINDPTVTGSANGWFTPLYDEMGRDFFQKLLKQEPVVLRDQRLMSEWVAKAKYPVLLAPDEQSAADFMKAGAPIVLFQMKEGKYVTQSNGAVSMATKPPHPNAAKLVINWALSKEGGKALAEAQMSQSARTDVPADFLPASNLRMPGGKYVDTTKEDYQNKMKDALALAKDIFDPYLKK